MKIEFSHIRRQGNKSAHLLAKHASSIDDMLTILNKLLFIMYFPFCVCNKSFSAFL